MTIGEYITSVLAFRNIPTTILILAIYIATFTSVLVTDRLPNVPKNQRGLNLTEAYADLHQVAAVPHPYNSHANDVVRSYVLSRVAAIAHSHPHVHVDSDLQSNFTTSSPNYGVYFEGTNVLVKIDGTDAQFQTKGGLALSAHYDSVSTAPGVTDDGMGVVTLIQLVKYFAERRPKRTVIFNINNGEEDWLNGARAFLEHPWANITDTFINLEGAASGGRPVLFRATSSFPVKSFARGVRHPHGNVLSADAFARGVIRSGTDYSVYTSAGMRGLDFAFYKGRSMYHTKDDSIPNTVGLEKALWAMMETAKGSAWWLANAAQDEGRNEDSGIGLGDMGEVPVYFDLFGSVFLVFPLSVLFITNIVLLVVGPLILLLFFTGNIILQHRRRRQQEENYTREAAMHQAWSDLKAFSWVGGLWRWSKFWLALVITVGLQIPLIVGFMKLNPYVVYSNPMLPLVSSFALAYLTLTLTFALPTPGPLSLPERQKQTALHQTYFLTWIFLLVATILINKAHIGGFYWMTAWNALVWVGCIIGSIAEMFGAKGSGGDVKIDVVDPDVLPSAPRRPPRFESSSEVDHEQNQEENYENHEQNHEEQEQHQEEDASEETPLLGQRKISRGLKRLIDDNGEDSGAIGWWILQLLVVVPIPIALVAHIAVILLGALPQTLADGSSAANVYGTMAFVSVLLIIPIAPFAVKLHRFVAYAFITVFVITTLWGWFLVAPFDAESPFKVFFQQIIDLDTNITETRLTGLSPYLQRSIVPGLPSAQGKSVDCHSVGKNDKKSGLHICTWESGQHMIPSTGVPSKKPIWMQVHANRTSEGEAQITITGSNTRNCRLYFEDKGISAWKVRGGDSSWSKVQTGAGMKEVRLWSRTWSKDFVTSVQWVNNSDKLKGRVACEWAEYESGTVGLEVPPKVSLAKIPAYEEVLRFLPKWAVASKTTDGLVEVSQKFEV